MNAPETIKPINDAHKVLMEANDALCVEDVARAILGGDKPSKIDIKTATRKLKQLADLGMIEVELRAGGVPFYRLIAAPVAEISGVVIPPPPEYDPASVAFFPAEIIKGLTAGDSEGGETDAPAANAQRDEFTLLGLIADIRAAAGDPAGRLMQDELVQHIAAVVKERDDLRERMEGIAEQLRAGTIPELENVTGAEGLAPHVKTLCDSLGAAEIVATGRGHTIDGLRLEVKDLRDRLDAQIKQWQADTGELAQKAHRLAADLEDMTRERDLLKAENLALKTSEGATPGFSAELQALRTSHTNAINEADRLRAELDTERQAREALQEQSDAVDVKDAAVGYLVRVPKRAPILRRKPESARDAALSAVRAGAKRADVLAVVPVGTARRGAEWQSTEAGD